MAIGAVIVAGLGIAGQTAVQKATERAVRRVFSDELSKGLNVKADVVGFGGDHPNGAWPLVHLPGEPGSENACATFKTDGWRCVCPTISFSSQEPNRPFRYAPKVVVSVKAFDILNENRMAMRLNTWVESGTVTKDSFRAVLCTWNQTKVYSAEVSWLAFGVAE